jgi:hypothetical protein
VAVARFTDPHHLEGSFELDAENCDGPSRTFAAHAAGHHSGCPGHHHGPLHGTPFGEYPDLSRATPRRLAQARRLWRASVRESRGRFATYTRARRLGFRSKGIEPRDARFFHLRHAGYAATPESFDAKHRSCARAECRPSPSTAVTW